MMMMMMMTSTSLRSCPAGVVREIRDAFLLFLLMMTYSRAVVVHAAPISAPPQPFTLTFDAFSAGTWLGTVAPGMTVTGQPRSATAVPGSYGPSGQDVRVFDTARPTGGDTDLGSPNKKCGGPGQGVGGQPGQPYANCAPLGHVLILQEACNATAIPNCTVTAPPNDGASGGRMTFAFGLPVTVTSVGILDNEKGSVLTATRSSGLPSLSVTAPLTGNNGYALVTLNATQVRSLEILDQGSGAVAVVNLIKPPFTCPYGWPGPAAACALFQWGPYKVNLATTSSTNVPRPVVQGSVCLAPRSQLSPRQGPALVVGDLLTGPSVKLPSDVSSWVVGLVSPGQPTLSAAATRLAAQAAAWAQLPCTTTQTARDFGSSLVVDGPMTVVCLYGSVPLDYNVIFLDTDPHPSHQLYINVFGNLRIQDATVSLIGLESPQVIWNVVGPSNNGTAVVIRRAQVAGTLVVPEQAVQVQASTVLGSIHSGRRVTLSQDSVVDCVTSANEAAASAAAGDESD